MLKVDDLSVQYGKHLALSNAELNVDVGEIVVILGANGSGKSTLLNAIAGTSEGKVSGRVQLQQHQLSDFPADQIVATGVAFVPEGRGVFADLTVEENINLGAWTVPENHTRQQALSQVYGLFPKLEERKKQTVSTMSGGEQQMVAIGRALMSDPKLLMLDEPSLGLSPLLCKELFQSLARIREAGMGVLLVEQNAKQSLAIADRGYLLENGHISTSDTAAALLNNPSVQAAYLGGATSSLSASDKQASGLAQAAASEQSQPVVNSSADSLLNGMSIDKMVASAAALSAPAPQETPIINSSLIANVHSDVPARQSDSKTPGEYYAVDRSTEMTLSTSGSTPDISKQLPDTGTTDPEIAALLSSIESAAKNARLSDSDHSVKSNSTRSSEEDTESLPTIPVYRKQTVQVWKRNSHGKLTRQD